MNRLDHVNSIRAINLVKIRHIGLTSPNCKGLIVLGFLCLLNPGSIFSKPLMNEVSQKSSVVQATGTADPAEKLDLDTEEVTKARESLTGESPSGDIEPRTEEPSAEELVLMRVGGDYKVASIEKLERGFKLVFESTEKTGEADYITLISDHVHFGIEKHAKVRISAEVKSTGEHTAEAYQVLVYLPAPEGFLPVWLLSQKSRGFEKGKTNYLKMHAPQSDYMIF